MSHRNIQVTDEVYNRLDPKRNKLGGRDPRKIGFSEVIGNALDAYEAHKKIAKTSERKYKILCENCDNKDKMCNKCKDKNKFHGWLR